jgi:hypothetical protein
VQGPPQHQGAGRILRFEFEVELDDNELELELALKRTVEEAAPEQPQVE